MSFIAIAKLTKKQVCSSNLPTDLISLTKVATPMMEFLCDVLAVPY